MLTRLVIRRFKRFVEADVELGNPVVFVGTGLAVLRAFAKRPGHPAFDSLERPFVDYVRNQPQLARDRFHGLQEAVPALQGFALFDRLDHAPDIGANLVVHCWSRREIENYLCQPQTLVAWAREAGGKRTLGGLFALAGADLWERSMQEELARLVPPVALDDPADPYWIDTKATDQFLDRLFAGFYHRVVSRISCASRIITF